MKCRCSLYSGTGFEAFWAIAKPWLEYAPNAALRATSPIAVLAPTRAHANAIKQRVLDASINLAGIWFLTPGEARDKLRITLCAGSRPAARPELRLLAAALLEREQAPFREPDRLIRALETSAFSGWPLDTLVAGALKTFADAFGQAVRDAGWRLIPQLDRDLLAAAGNRPVFHRLLIWGFDAAHWEYVHLLFAAARSAEECAVFLNAPRSKAEALDQIWIGSWEQQFGPCEPVGDGTGSGPFAPLAQGMENPESFPTRFEKPVFLIGRTLQEQAKAVVAQALVFAADPHASRIGIVVPGPGALAREISIELSRIGAQHFDSFGRTPQPDEVARRWMAWVSFQRRPTINEWLKLSREDPSFAPALAEQEELARAFAECMVDDLPVLKARLEMSPTEPARNLAQRLARFRVVPNRASVKEWIDWTFTAWRELQWDSLVSALQLRVKPLEPLLGLTVSSSAWLDWLGAAAPRPGPVRSEESANPFAKIHIVSYAQAEGLPWSHLILAGLNDGEWPPASEPFGFLTNDELRLLNQSAVSTGSQGQGHLTARAGYAIILSERERRDIHRRQFYNLVETPSRGLAAACALHRGDGSGRVAPASDFLSHMYFCATGHSLSESAMERLCGETRRFLEAFPWPAEPSAAPQAVPPENAGAARKARLARSPFGRYECAFEGGPPPRPAVLTCKGWESAVRDPMSAWLAAYLRVEAPPDFRRGDFWPLVKGIWIHQWLADALCDARNQFMRRHAGAALSRRVRDSCARTRAAIADCFRGGGRDVPQAWSARLAETEWIALSFARNLAQVSPDEWPIAAAEWSLPQEVILSLGEKRALILRGRIDAAFAGPDSLLGVPNRCWIIDFKSGSYDHPLRAESFERALKKGRGLQISLYALAVAALGAEEVSVSLLKENTLPKPQLSLAEIRQRAKIWCALAHMQDTGVFGIRGDLRAEYGAALKAPIATLPIDPQLLEEKWALTHPALSLQEDEDEQG